MAKYTEIEGKCRKIVEDARNGVFAPVYLLMGGEPYYPDMVCDAIMKYALQDDERDFNQAVYYGLDTDADAVASEARSYPMMAERRLVVLKEAQSMKTLEGLGVYAAEPMDTTVLVILMHGASADKRKALYKNVSKKGIVLESEPLRDYEMPGWITGFYKSRGLAIDPDAAALLAESAGTELDRIAVETEKLQKNLPEGTTRVTAADIEKNVGISRQFSIFELTNPGMPKMEKAKLLGVNPYFLEEYDVAARNFPVRRCMKVMSRLEEYDFKGKGGGSGEAGQDELLLELVNKILI